MVLYDIFFILFSIIYLPYLILKGKAHRDFSQRFGKLPQAFKEASLSRPVWVHAVSVGEVLAAKNFVEKLTATPEGVKVVLSTTTKTGNAVAQNVLGKDILKFYFPLDLSFAVRRAVDLINPRLMVIMETEIWPNLILELSGRKIPIVLLNGRISNKSFEGYRRIKFLFGDIFKRIDMFSMQTDKDAERIKALGAPEKNVIITGSMKFDIDLRENVTRSKSELGIDESSLLIIAGSTHPGEEEVILGVYGKLAKEFQDLRLLIAPRHIDRVGSIKNLIEQKGFKAVALSEFIKRGRKNPVLGDTVLILDTLGELRHLYRLATIVFMGGSLVRRGGHNLAEPAVFAKPILFGPHMFNFRDMARSFLEDNAAIEVKNSKELFNTLKILVKEGDKRAVLGSNAKKLIEKNKGATDRNICEVKKFI
ncbi:MAG: hypothetical protein A2Z72_00880 [Omnitrophica bacterium RBG_13_46_9]|nr:MAG: hypothetical protein A2Z72_00880 [Omnitrophica bacterium RBG_13_46_9]